MRILRACVASVLILCCVFLCGDAFLKAPAKEPVPEQTETAEHEPYDYDLSEYLTLPDLTAVQASFDDPGICTDKELEDQIFQILLANADFEEKWEKLKAERYNKVLIDFAVMQNGQVLADYSRADYELVIGLDTGNGAEIVLGEALMGSRVGEVRTADYTYPESLTDDGLAGETVVLSATVKKIYRQIVPELTDATVAELFDGAFSTVQEFRDSVRADILKEKEKNQAKAVWIAIDKSADVKKYPERELKLAVEAYYRTYEEIAKGFELELEQLVKVYLEQDMEAFAEDAKIAAEEKVRNDMIMTQLVRLQGITLSEEEYLAGVQEYFAAEESQFGSLEEFIEYYTEENLRQNILWDKALRAVVARAVPVA